MKTLLLIDLNNLIYRFPFTLPNLYFNNAYTGGLYGFVKSLCACVNAVRPHQILIADDYPPYKRSLLGYKSERKKDSAIIQKIQDSRELCQQFLQRVQIPVIKNKGYEADDIIAEIVSLSREEFKKIVIYSNDSDLYQLFHLPQISFWKNIQNLYYRSDFLKDYPKVRLDEFPAEWIFFLALTGGHNDLPKPQGVGPVRAWEIIRKGTIEQYFEKETLRTILKYIRLPYDNKVLAPSEKKKLQSILKIKRAFSSGAVIDLFSRYGISVDKNMELAFRFLEQGKFVRGDDE